MSKRKYTKYENEYKAKLVLEILKGQRTINEIASEQRVIPANLKLWKKQFTDNMELVFDQEKAVVEYKDKLRAKEQEIEKLYTEIGRLNIQLTWAKKKSIEAGLSE